VVGVITSTAIIRRFGGKMFGCIFPNVRLEVIVGCLHGSGTINQYGAPLLNNDLDLSQKK
jgi:hypothetical protein